MPHPCRELDERPLVGVYVGTDWLSLGMSVTHPPRSVLPGDTVALLAPASWCEEDWIDESIERLESWGLQVHLGKHVRDRHGYLAGTDEDRLDDLNCAIRDPQVRAIVCLRGGCGSFRLAHDVDVAALRADPKPLVGFSDITALHRVWHAAGVQALHGAVAGAHADGVRTLLAGVPPEPVRADPSRFGAELTTGGRAAGPLFGGNLEMLARSVGVTDSDLAGHILLLEINLGSGLGAVDSALSQLVMSEALGGIIGIALGELAGFADQRKSGWTIIDVLRDRLALLDVPVLAGLPLGHLADPVTVPLGVHADIDVGAGRLNCSALCAEAGMGVLPRWVR